MIRHVFELAGTLQDDVQEADFIIPKPADFLLLGKLKPHTPGSAPGENALA